MIPGTYSKPTLCRLIFLFYKKFPAHILVKKGQARKGDVKMIEARKSPFDSAIKGITDIFPALITVNPFIKQRAYEIRLRCGGQIRIMLDKGSITLPHRVTNEELERCVATFCRNSVHSYEKEIANGFLTLDKGHRAGLCGTAVYTEGKITAIKNISSINIRIAREHRGIADKITPLFFSDNPPTGLLIAGKPLTGKTSLLRELIRCISSEYKITLIDERYEIASVSKGIPALDVGEMTDVLTGFYKNDGIGYGVRTMSPDYIAMDELGFDIKGLKTCINCGVGIICTCHIHDISALTKDKGLWEIITGGNISHIVYLKGNPGTAYSIYTKEQLKRKEYI